MTSDVRLQFAEVWCAVASCNVRAELILVVTCDVRVCGAFKGLRSATAILYIILAIMKELTVANCFLLV